MRTSDLLATVDGRLSFHAIGVSPDILVGCARYLELLAKWNRMVNLTALTMDGTDDQLASSVDKLVVEPLIGARLLGALGVVPEAWFDLGSGGGSPSIPMRLAVPAGSLTLVESRSKKCAFLREVVRSLHLSGTRVFESRFELLEQKGDLDLVSVRAVRLDAPFLDFVCSLLQPGGHMLSFGTRPEDCRMLQVASEFLPDGSSVYLMRHQSVPRGTSKDELHLD